MHCRALLYTYNKYIYTCEQINYIAQHNSYFSENSINLLANSMRGTLRAFWLRRAWDTVQKSTLPI